MVRMTLATDDFTRADSLDLGAAWDHDAGVDGLKLIGNEARPANLTSIPASWSTWPTWR